MSFSKPSTTGGKDLPGAFVGHKGELYIRVRKVQPGIDDKYTTRTAVYPSIESYNNRSTTPHYVELGEVSDDYEYTVEIDPQTLTIMVQE